MPTPLNPHRPGTQAELNDHLAATIGNDVLQAMESIGWEHSQTTPVAPTPLAGTEQATPAQTPPSAVPNAASPVATPTVVNWEQFRDPVTGLILGKYRDPENAAKGMHSLLHMAKEAITERDQLRQRLENPSTGTVQTTAMAATPEVVARSPKLDAILQKAKENEGLEAADLPGLIEALREDAQAVASRQVEQDRQHREAAQGRWGNVDAYMQQHHPQALLHADQMKLFLSTKPEYGRTYNRLLTDAGATDPELDASLFAWAMFSSANPHVLEAPIDPALVAQERELQAAGTVRREEVDAARVAAGLSGTSAGGVHEATSQRSGASQDEVDAAARLMIQTGRGDIWRGLTIARDLNHPLFDNP